MDQKPLTTDEAAAILGVSVEVVRDLIREKLLQAFKPRRDWRIQPAELESYIRRTSNVKPTSPKRKAADTLVIKNEPNPLAKYGVHAGGI